MKLGRLRLTDVTSVHEVESEEAIFKFWQKLVNEGIYIYLGQRNRNREFWSRGVGESVPQATYYFPKQCEGFRGNRNKI